LPKIVDRELYNGSGAKIKRLELDPLVSEIEGVLTGFNLSLREEKDANGGKEVRLRVDERFATKGGWIQGRRSKPDVDWIKCLMINGRRICVGVEVQFSARSEMTVVDIIHLRRDIVAGKLDLGIILTSSERMAPFLTNRGPSFSVCKKIISELHAEEQPLILYAVEHDSPGPALPKQKKR